MWTIGVKTKPLDSIEPPEPVKDLKSRRRNYRKMNNANSVNADLVAALDASGDCFYLLDGAFNFTYMNKASEQFFNVARDLIIGKYIWDVFPDDFHSDGSILIREVMESRVSRTSSVRSATKLGHIVTLHVFCVGDGVGVSFQDRHDEHAAEQALQRSLDHYKLAIEATNLGTWELDRKTGIARVDGRFREIFGLTEDVVVTHTLIMSYVLPEDKARAHDVFTASFNSSTPSDYHNEYRVIVDGRERWISSRGRSIIVSGEIVGMIGSVRDITESKSFANDLAEEKRILETINRTGSMLAAELDLDKLISVMTESAVSIVGAEFGAYFQKVRNEEGTEVWRLSTLHGAPFEAFSSLGQPRKTHVFKPTFDGIAIVRSEDITVDPRFSGMPMGHLPVRSYLAVPVVSRTGETHGSLLFGHKRPRIFGESVERKIRAIAAQAAIAIDNAKLYQDVQRELEERKHAEAITREALSRVEGVLQSTTDCVVMLDSTWRFTFANARALKLTNKMERDLYGRRLTDIYPIVAVSGILDQMRAASESGQSTEFQHYFKNADRWLEGTIFPSAQGITIFFRDVTQQKKHADELKEREIQFRQLADTMPQQAWKADAGGIRYWYNRRWHEYTGTNLRDARGWGWLKLYHPDDVAAAKALVLKGLQDKTEWEGTFRIRGRNGEYRWFLVKAAPILDRKGQAFRWFGTNTDISATMEAQEHQELLLHELNHRVKNTLATIQSIARQTLSDDPNEFRVLFESRLLALSKTHDLLTDGQWNSAPLRDLIASEFQPYMLKNQPLRYKMLGPDVKLKPAAVVLLGMALHELITNAVKYGSLSVSEGYVDVVWEVKDERLRIYWCEGGGPEVAKPTRKGFGTRLLQHSFRGGDLSGNVDLQYKPTGVECTMDMSAENIARDNEERELFRIK